MDYYESPEWTKLVETGTDNLYDFFGEDGCSEEDVMTYINESDIMEYFTEIANSYGITDIEEIKEQAFNDMTSEMSPFLQYYDETHNCEEDDEFSDEDFF